MTDLRQDNSVISDVVLARAAKHDERALSELSNPLILPKIAGELLAYRRREEANKEHKARLRAEYVAAMRGRRREIH